MKRYLVCLIPALFGQFAAAQPFDEVAIETESVTVFAPSLQETGPSETEPVTAEFSLSGEAERVFENGLRLRINTVLRSQFDTAVSAGTTRSFGDDLIAPGAFSGQAGGFPSRSDSLRTRLETAYVQLDGSLGEVRIGKDRGVAARFFEGPPSELSHARFDAPLLDPAGLSLIRTRHDVTGPSAKVSYATPRILGIRGGFSVTPDAHADGLDRRIGLARDGLDGGLDEAYEVAVNASRLIASLDMRFEGMLAWSSSAVDEPSTDIGDDYLNRVETVSAGGKLRHNNWTIGASWASSDDGVVGGDYRAWTVGIGRPAYGVDWSFGYGSAEDGRTGLEADSWRIAAAKDVGEIARVSLGYLSDEGGPPDSVAKAHGVVVEVTLSTEIFNISGF